MIEIVTTVTTQSWLVLGQMAPYLLLGFLVAGVLSVCISPQRVERHLGGRGFGPVLKAALFGVPLPLCSCGVIPVSASLSRHGASRAATTSFLLSTPQTGVDSIAVTYALLGPVLAVFRPIAALLTGIFGGLLVQLLGEPHSERDAHESPASACTDDCCAGDEGGGAIGRALRYGFVTLPRDIGLALVVGILIAGVMAAVVPQDRLGTYLGGGVLSILLLMAVGVPVYVCATASVPIAAGFMHMGASPGAALAFLIAGPATHAASFTTIWKVLGRRTAILYLTTVAVSAVVCGLLLDWLVPALATAMPELAAHDHAAAEGGWFANMSAVALIAMLFYSYWSRPKAAVEDGHVEHAETDEQRLVLLVGGMNCSHCSDSVRRGLASVAGVRSADVNLASGRAVVRGSGLRLEELVTQIVALGYSAEPAAADRDP